MRCPMSIIFSLKIKMTFVFHIYASEVIGEKIVRIKHYEIEKNDIIVKTKVLIGQAYPSGNERSNEITPEVPLMNN